MNPSSQIDVVQVSQASFGDSSATTTYDEIRTGLGGSLDAHETNGSIADGSIVPEPSGVETRTGSGGSSNINGTGGSIVPAPSGKKGKALTIQVFKFLSIQAMIRFS